MTQQKKGLFYVTLAPVLWGGSGVAVDYVFRHGVSPNWLINIRLLISGTLILLATSLKKDTKLFSILKTPRDIFSLVIYSIFGMFAVQFTYFITIDYTGPSTATILQFTNAVMMSLVVAVQLRAWPKRVEIISLVMAVVGVLFLVTNGKFNELNISPLGLFWGLLSAVAAVTYVLLPLKLVKHHGALATVGWAMIVAGVLFNFYAPFWQDVPTLTPKLILLIAGIIVFGTIIPFITLLEGLKYVKPTTTSMVGAMEPLAAAILSIVLLGQHLSGPQIIGFVLVIGTVFVQAFDQPRVLPAKDDAANKESAPQTHLTKLAAYWQKLPHARLLARHKFHS